MSVKTRRQTTSHINSQDNHAIIYIINKNKYTGKDTFTLTLTHPENADIMPQSILFQLVIRY